MSVKIQHLNFSHTCDILPFSTNVTFFKLHSGTSTWSALPPTLKSLDLEALRRALCRSVKNFLTRLDSIYYLQWMDDHAHLRTMIQEGKDGLEWYRCKDLSSFHNRRCCPGRWTRQGGNDHRKGCQLHLQGEMGPRACECLLNLWRRQVRARLCKRG